MEEANNYEHHLRGDTFAHLALLEGFVSARILKRAVPEGTELLIVTVWQSQAAIEQFAGEDVWVAVVPSMVRQMMVSYELTARHCEFVEEFKG